MCKFRCNGRSQLDSCVDERWPMTVGNRMLRGLLAPENEELERMHNDYGTSGGSCQLSAFLHISAVGVCQRGSGVQARRVRQLYV